MNIFFRLFSLAKQENFNNTSEAMDRLKYNILFHSRVPRLSCFIICSILSHHESDLSHITDEANQ
jgi:hypothetical protein